MLCRPGSGLPIESQVLRPMTMGLPSVSALKRLRSSGRCHGNRPSRPIAPRSSVATMIETSGTADLQAVRAPPPVPAAFFFAAARFRFAAALRFLATSSGSRSSIVPRHCAAPQRQA